MSINDKLNTLALEQAKTLKTKEAFKQAFFDTGVEISDDLPFSDYPNKILGLSANGMIDFIEQTRRANLNDETSNRNYQYLCINAVMNPLTFRKILDYMKEHKGHTYYNMFSGATIVVSQRDDMFKNEDGELEDLYIKMFSSGSSETQSTFSSLSVQDEAKNPCYYNEDSDPIVILDLSNTKYLQSSFYRCKAGFKLKIINAESLINIATCFRDSNITFDFSEAVFSTLESIANGFQECTGLKSIDLISATKLNSIGYAFYGCTELEEVLNLKPCTNSANVFGNNGKLKRLTFIVTGSVVNIKALNLANNQFTREAMLETLNTLPTLTSTQNLTLTGNPCIAGVDADGNTVDVLTDEDKQIAVNKGWTVVI